MEWREKPSVMRRGAAPPDERKSAIVLAIAAAVHLLLIPAFTFRLKPPTEISLPSGAPSPARVRLVRLTPLRTLPPAEQEAASAKAKPKPALLKKFTQNAKIAIREERAPVKKGKSEETKAKPEKEAAPVPAVDLLPRWFSADSSRVTSAKTDGDFRFAYYLAALRNKIGSRWVPPQGVGGRGRTVKTIVYFRVHRDGQVSQTSVETSSGYAFFDQTALRALLAAAPLPPLPAGFPDNYLGVHFGFEFQQ